MRLFFVIPFLLGTFLFINGCESGTTNGEPGIKIAVADVSRLMRDSVPGKAGIKFLESRQAIFQKELDDIQEKLEKNPSDEAAMKDLQRVYTASQQQIQAEGQNVAAMLFDTLQRVLDRFREQKGYTLILSQDTVASFAKGVDITEEVMRELDKENIDFKPLPASAPVEIELPDPSKEPAAPKAEEKVEEPQAKQEETTDSGKK